MKKYITILILVIAISTVYQFVIRPIQRDKKLEDCLYGKYVSYEVPDMQAYKDECFRKYGK